jgi:hypothetical protein
MFLRTNRYDSRSPRLFAVCITVIVALTALLGVAQGAAAAPKPPKSQLQPGMFPPVHTRPQARGSRHLMGINGYKIYSGFLSAVSLPIPHVLVGPPDAHSWSTTSRRDDAQYFYWQPWLGVGHSDGTITWLKLFAQTWAHTGWVSEQYDALVPFTSYLAPSWSFASGNPIGSQLPEIPVPANATSLVLYNYYAIYDRNTATWMYDEDSVQIG